MARGRRARLLWWLADFGQSDFPASARRRRFIAQGGLSTRVGYVAKLLRSIGLPRRRARPLDRQGPKSQVESTNARRRRRPRNRPALLQTTRPTESPKRKIRQATMMWHSDIRP